MRALRSNPPYARETARWIGRLADHGNGIALVFVRSDTPWWQAAARRSSCVCFVEGRVRFVEGKPGQRKAERRDSRPGAASCLLAFGDECAAALRGSALGVCAEMASVDRQMELAA